MPKQKSNPGKPVLDFCFGILICFLFPLLALPFFCSSIFFFSSSCSYFPHSFRNLQSAGTTSCVFFQAYEVQLLDNDTNQDLINCWCIVWIWESDLKC